MQVPVCLKQGLLTGHRFPTQVIRLRHDQLLIAMSVPAQVDSCLEHKKHVLSGTDERPSMRSGTAVSLFPARPCALVRLDAISLTWSNCDSSTLLTACVSVLLVLREF